MMSILSRKVLVAVVFCAVAVCLCGAFGLYLLLAPEPRAIGYRDSGSVQSTTTLRTGNNQSISFSTAEGLGHGEKTSLMFTQPDQSNVSLTIPEKLGDSATYTLRQSEDQHRLILVTERGVAVWRNAVPHELLHVWDATSEPLAGPKGEYAQNKLMLEFNVSPDGTLACIHAVKQTAFDYRESKDGLVLVRDLETGQDIGHLSFPGEGLVQSKVAWSRDSRRLATYSDDKHEVAVWKLPERGSPREKSNAVRVGTIPGIFQDFHFSKNTEHMYLLTERLGYIPNKLSVQTIFDGTVVCESSLQNILRIHASPDGQSGIAVVTPGRGGATLNMLDSQTLDTLWSSPCRGGIRQIAYRQDGLVLAATWFIPNELFGSTAGVKAWNKSGTVVLDEQISHWNKDELSFTPEGCLQAGTHLFTPITP